MEYARKNTVKVRFTDQSRSPTDAEMVTFVTRNMGIKPDQVSHLYYDPFEKCIVIKFIGETLMKMCLEQHVGEKLFNFSNGQFSRVMITDGNEEIKYVRIFYLPPEVPDQEVLDLLKKFGSVKRIVHEKRPMASGFCCFSGTRGIYMDVQKEIPPQLYICNNRCRVYYTGMHEKCFICKASDHLKSDCPRRAGDKGEGASGSKLTPRGRAAASEKEQQSTVRDEEDGAMIVDEQLGSVVKKSSIVKQGEHSVSESAERKESEWFEVKPKSGKDVGSKSNGEFKQRNDSESSLSGRSRDRKRADGSNGSLNNVSDGLVSSNPFGELDESMDNDEGSDTDPKRIKMK